LGLIRFVIVQVFWSPSASVQCCSSVIFSDFRIFSVLCYVVALTGDLLRLKERKFWASVFVGLPVRRGCCIGIGSAM